MYYHRSHYNLVPFIMKIIFFGMKIFISLFKQLLCEVITFTPDEVTITVIMELKRELYVELFAARGGRSKVLIAVSID